ncbi:MAG: ribulose-phosphate 3-epimerase [Bacillota bacterium]
MKPIVSASILAADPLYMGRDVEMILAAGADWLHVDVMDGSYVPNITFGPALVRSLRQATGAPLDVHLMMREPERYIEDFARAGADYLTVHPEACTHLHRVLGAIREAGCKAGVALNPATVPGVLDYVWAEVDLILLMSVNPGFGGQKFIPATLEKLREVDRRRRQLARPLLLSIDGGVNASNSPDLVRAGVDVLVAGSALFNSENPAGVIKEMHQAAQ